MKLEHLKLENFRGFASFEISFDPQFTVLLGDNMAGKTAVLNGAAVALGAFFRSSGLPAVRRIENDEVHYTVRDINGVPDLQLQFPVLAEVRVASQAGRPLIFAQTRNEGSTETYPEGDLDRGLSAHRSSLEVWPIIAHYGTQRVVRGQPIQEHRGVGSRLDGYVQCFDTAPAHAVFVGWLQKQTLVQLQRGSGYRQPQLLAVESAVKSCIAGVRRFWFDVQYDEIRLERTNGDIQSFAMLSEGLRNMVAMVANIAWRAAVLNPKLGAEAHLQTDGVVLIDELDLHLHPAWQRRIVGDLQRTFPKIQFIVTTHSPQIVASVHRTQVRMLDNNRLVGKAPHVEGRATNEILEDVFGVSARPDDVQTELNELYQLIEDESFAAARTRLAVLRERLGPDDSDMVRAQWILDTEDPATNEQPTAAP